MGGYKNCALFRRAKAGPRCPGCAYYRQISTLSGDRCCHYCLDMHKVRGSSPASCNKRVEIRVEVQYA